MKTFFKYGICSLIISILFHLSCKKENQPPIAHAGLDQYINTDYTLLNGTASRDHEDNYYLLKAIWTQISGPDSAYLINDHSIKTLLINLVPGIYEFQLHVEDQGGLTSSDIVRIIIDAIPVPSTPPVANAGKDQTVINRTAFLDGSASSSPDVNIGGSYSWSHISGPTSYTTFSNANSSQTQVSNLIQLGDYLFELKVIDKGGISRDTVQVTVAISLPEPKVPVANAGQDITVLFDRQTCVTTPAIISLDGTASKDSNGIIVSYLWQGPGNIVSPGSAITEVNNLLPGDHTFYLTVTNDLNGENTAMMMVHVELNPKDLNFQNNLILIGPNSGLRYEVAIGSTVSKLVFAGGRENPMCFYDEDYGPILSASSSVDIYDVNTHIWSFPQLSAARSGIGTATNGNKIFFAGGYACDAGNSDFRNKYYSNVDIYDASKDTWSLTHLSLPRSYISVASVGNKVLFSGGFGPVVPGDLVEIYDLGTNTWSKTTHPTQGQITCNVTVNSKIYFVISANDGACSMDIYDNNSDSWSTKRFQELSYVTTGVALNNQIYWTGIAYSMGNTFNKIEIQNVITGNTSTMCLTSDPHNTIAQSNNIIIYGNKNVAPYNPRLEMYNTLTGIWSVSELNHEWEGASLFTANNTAYLTRVYGDGNFSNEVWKLEF